MHYEKANEKVPVAPIETSRLATNKDYRQNSDIRRTRTIVLVLLGIQFVFTLFYFIERCVELGQNNRLPAASRDERVTGSLIGSLVAALVSLIYIIVFIFVVIKYMRIGILIFAWLGLIHLIFILIIIILVIIAIIAISAGFHSAGIGIAFSVVIIIIAAIACILTILIVAFSFKLAKLLRMQEAYQFV